MQQQNSMLQSGSWTNGSMKRTMHRTMDGTTNRQMNGQIIGPMNETASGQMNGPMNGTINKTNGRSFDMIDTQPGSYISNSNYPNLPTNINMVSNDSIHPIISTVSNNNKRPYIILKWAETIDGFIAPKTRDEQKPVWVAPLVTYPHQ